MKSACLATLALLVVAPALAEDTRQLASLHPQAQETLRQEMRDNLMALNQIVTLLATNQVKEAGELAEKALGRGAMGQHARKPFEARPGPQMPTAMHDIGRSSHNVASDFARAAATGDRDKALAELPAVLGACVACHSSYRIR